MRNFGIVRLRFVGCLNEEGFTNFDEADLNLGVGADPEVGSDTGPDGRGVVELEAYAGIGDSERFNSEVIGADEVEAEALQS